jgi:Holliday junction DNA helicase RuvA
MIERLEGEFLEVGASHLLISLGGLGIRVEVPRSVADRFRDATSGVIWTRLLVRDGEPHLYGFAAPGERDCFDSLLGVSGVGARIALGILSFLDPSALALSIERGSTDELVAVPGVGRKLANRIVLELKGRLPVGLEDEEIVDGSALKVQAGGDAVQALTALGYPPRDSQDAVRKILRESAGEPPALDELVRKALLALNRVVR